MDKKLRVTTSNDLTSARYSLGLAESRLFLLALSQIKPGDKDLRPYKIYINDFLISCSLETQGYKNINKMKLLTKSLISRVIEVTKDDGDIRQFNLVSEANYKKDTKGAFVEISLNERIKPELLQLKEKFLSYDLRSLLTLKSFFSVRLYPLLKQYLYKNEYTDSIINLKRMFGVEKEYKLYGHFKVKVLLKAQQELKEKTDIYFEFEEIKTGRAVTDIKFLIFSQEREEIKNNQLANTPVNPQSAAVDPQTTKDEELQDKLVLCLRDLGFNIKDALNIIERETPDFILENAKILLEKQRAGLIQTTIPRFSKGFTIDYRAIKTIFELEQEEKATKIEEENHTKEQAEELGRTVKRLAQVKLVDNFFATITAEQEGAWNKYQKTPLAKILKTDFDRKITFISTKIFQPSELTEQLVKVAEDLNFVVDIAQNGDWLAYE